MEHLTENLWKLCSRACVAKEIIHCSSNQWSLWNICFDAICQKGGMSQNAEAFLALKSRFLIQDLSGSMAPSAKSLFIGR